GFGGLRGGVPDATPHPPAVPRFSVAGDTLTVAGVDYGDQGRFRCRAWTQLDTAEAEAELRVVAGGGGGGDFGIWGFWGPPDPFFPPPEFVVEQEEGIFSEGRFEERLTVPGGQPWATLTLSPYGRYRFRVRAVNGYGQGDPSAPSAAVST
ncbi:NGCA protein, partial [Eulacestoma nigropectus]|nr:NGCA protein [Eulacestoma nigropectus]